MIKFFIFLIICSSSIDYINSSSDIIHYWNHVQEWKSKGDCNKDQQSPINFETNQIEHYDSGIMKLILNDKQIETLVEKSQSTIIVNGKFLAFELQNIYGQKREFEALQFHFHAPSEHKVDGQSFDLEMHIVCKETQRSIDANKEKQRKYGVFGILFKLNQNAVNDPFFEMVNEQNLNQKNDVKLANYLYKKIEKLKIIDGKLEVYSYLGGLTTPPCTEVVNWFILKNPLDITSQILNRFTKHWAQNQNFANGLGNNRQTLPLNGRKVILANMLVEKKALTQSNSNYLNFSKAYFILISLLYILA